MKNALNVLLAALIIIVALTGCSNQAINKDEEYKKSLTYSNLADSTSQDEVKNAMELSGITSENIDTFFQNVNSFNNIIEENGLTKNGFTTIDSLVPEYDPIKMLELWETKNPEFLDYNCRITTYDLMKDSISIGKLNTENSSWLIFDELALESGPEKLFNQSELEEFKTLFSSIPTENTKDISVHVNKVKEDWKNKDIKFLNKDKRSIISVFFHDEEGYLFIGHMGVLIPSEDGKLLFLEKLSFQEPYQAVKFDSRIELNDYLMNKYDISWDQPTAKPFIMENDALLEGYRENPNNPESKTQ